MSAGPEELGRTIVFFPLVGLCLGLLLTAPFYWGLAGEHPMVQAWLFTGLNWYATRGLHWDGWADLSDAWGSGASGERFWSILKDSHLGAFGAMGLVLGLAGQIVLVQELMAARAFGCLAWSCVLGRTVLLVLASSARPLARPGLAKAFFSAASPRAAACGLAFCLLSGLWLAGPAALVAACVLAGLAACRLYRLARREQGMNGDFLGAVVVAAELAVPLAWLLCGQGFGR